MITCITETDTNLREITIHGTPDFPVQLYYDDFRRFPNGIVDWHWHPELEFAVTLSGSVLYRYADAALTLRPGDGIFINSGVLHMAEPADTKEDVVMFSVLFSERFLMDNTKSPVYTKYIQPVITNKCFPGTGLFPDVHWQEHVLQKLTDMYETETGQPYGMELAFQACLLDVWHTIVTHMSERLLTPSRTANDDLSTERAKQMLTFIHMHYSESISVDDIAAAASIGRSECFRCFARTIHKKPFAYLNEYRMANATRLLCESTLSVAEICFSCGFSHSSYFGRLFKEKTGLTPLSYRKKFAPR